MKKIIIIIYGLLTFSCQGDRRPPIAPIEQIIKNNVSSFIKEGLENDSTAYQAINWGNLDSLDALGFKYRIEHRYKSKGIFMSNNKFKNTIIQFDMTFLLDLNKEVVSTVDTKSYSKYFDLEGLPFNNYSTRELQKIGIKNDYSMVLFTNPSNRLLIVGGNREISKAVNISKYDWAKKYLKSASNSLLEKIDIIEYCENESSEECIEFIFQNDSLLKVNQINN